MDIRGVYMFSSLMKQNKKAKICFVICFAEKKKLLFYIYAVIVKQKIYKRSSNYYSCHVRVGPCDSPYCGSGGHGLAVKTMFRFEPLSRIFDVKTWGDARTLQ